MPTIQYTPAQRAAVDYRGGNLLLSAAAGSGKTAALTGRITRLIADGEAELSEMLIVTYTRAAAAEMRERIQKRLSETMEQARIEGDSVLAARASQAIAALPSAGISTIHSFLYQSLRPYFPALGLSPDARILEDRTVRTLRAEVMKDVVDDQFNTPDEPTADCASFTELADIIGQARDADAIDGELLWLEDRLTSTGGTSESLLRFADSLTAVAKGEADYLSTAYGDEIRRRVKDFAGHYANIYDDLQEDFPASPKVEKQYGPSLTYLLDWAKNAEKLADDPDTSYESLAIHINSLTFGRLPVVQKKDATDASLAFRFFRDEMKKEADSLKTECFSSSADEVPLCAGMTARILRRLAVVLEDFSARLTARKKELAALDYGDLETCALKLFTDKKGNRTRAAEEIGGRFKYIFIDEYQDVSDVQDRIFRALSPDASRFMVGDIKQSLNLF